MTHIDTSMKPCMYTCNWNQSRTANRLGSSSWETKALARWTTARSGVLPSVLMAACLVTIWGPKIGDPENPRVYHEYPFKRDYCIPPYSKRTPKPLVRVGEVTMSPLMHKPLGHWASDRGRGVGLLFLGQRQSGVYQPGLRVHRLAGECRREAQTMEWMLPEKVKSGWDGKKGSIFGWVQCGLRLEAMSNASPWISCGRRRCWSATMTEADPTPWSRRSLAPRHVSGTRHLYDPIYIYTIATMKIIICYYSCINC